MIQRSYTFYLAIFRNYPAQINRIRAFKANSFENLGRINFQNVEINKIKGSEHRVIDYC